MSGQTWCRVDSGFGCGFCRSSSCFRRWNLFVTFQRLSWWAVPLPGRGPWPTTQKSFPSLKCCKSEFCNSPSFWALKFQKTLIFRKIFTNRVFRNYLNKLPFHTADAFLPYSGVALKFVFICGWWKLRGFVTRLWWQVCLPLILKCRLCTAVKIQLPMSLPGFLAPYSDPYSGPTQTHIPTQLRPIFWPNSTDFSQQTQYSI